MKPEIPEVTVTGTEIARMPGISTAARNPRSPGAMILASVIGSPAATGFLATQPANEFRAARPAHHDVVLVEPPSGQTCQTRSSGRRIWPRFRSARATSTDRTGFGGVSGAASAISRDALGGEPGTGEHRRAAGENDGEDQQEHGASAHRPQPK